MSTDIFEKNGLMVTSYCGPAATAETTRTRLQFSVRSGNNDYTSLGFSEAVELHGMLGRWIELNEPEKSDASLITDEHHDELGDPLRRMLADLDYGQRNTLEKLLKLIHKEAYDEGRSDEAKP
jgi:hypothetical protein